MAEPNPMEPEDLSGRLLERTEDNIGIVENDAVRQDDLPHPRIRRLLYTSHFLSAWNSRAFEFGAFLFLATIYPQTLLPASVYALARAGSAAAFAPWIGKYIDKAHRLSVVRISIIGQRVAVAASCIILFTLVQVESLRRIGLASYGMLALLSLLACVEKLSAVMNTISVERDWVVVIAQNDDGHLRTMNSQMRRIDLFCKLAAPLFVSFIDSASSRVAILVTGGTTAVSVLIEYVAIARVYKAVPALAAEKRNSTQENVSSDLWSRLRDSISSLTAYLRHPAFLPSFALALLYLTVLSFSGQMITYLIAIGLHSSLIGILRGVSALFEMSATWIAPRIMQRIGPIRTGIWFLNWQLLCVATACIFFWLDVYPALAAVGTVTAVIASRIGLWGFDLSAQIIVQEEVEAELRGTFSSQEFAFQNVFEMLSFASTIAFAKPAQFRYPATISAAAVGVAGILYAAFVRSRRGHLVHLSRCMERHSKFPGVVGQDGWRRLPQYEEDGGDGHELSEGVAGRNATEATN